MALTPAQREASRYLGLLIDEATTSRLKIHGFHGAGFGCVARGMEPPRSISSALSVCIEEAAEPVRLSGVGGSSAQDGPEAEGQVEQHQGEAGGVHGASIGRACRSGELVPS